MIFRGLIPRIVVTLSISTDRGREGDEMMNSYLVTLAEREAVRGAEAFAEALDMPLMAVLDADRTQRIIVQCCPLCLESFLDEVLADPGLRLTNPVVVHIDAHGAEHVPLLEPAGE